MQNTIIHIVRHIRSVLSSLVIGISIAVAAMAMAPPAHAEGRIRIAEQFGVVYLLPNVAQDQKLIERVTLRRRGMQR
jgi:NitT/TauT family transport system substrate-binding protein